MRRTLTIVAAFIAVLAITAQVVSLNNKKTLQLRTEKETSIKFHDGKPLEWPSELGPRDIPQREVAEDGIVEYLYKCETSSWGGYYTTHFRFDTNNKTVTIDNLCGFLNSNYFDGVELTASYNDNREIEFACASIYPDEEGATYVGLYNDYYDVYLRAGKFDASTYTVELVDNLVLTFNEDYSEITANGNMIMASCDDGTGAEYALGNSGYNTTGAVFKKVPEGQLSSCETTSLEFASVFAGQSTAQSFTLTSTGSENVQYTMSFDNDAFKAPEGEESGEVPYLSYKKLNVLFAPSAPGEYTGTLTLKAGDIEYTIALKGVCKEVPTDFSELVTEGDATRMTWDNSDAYPWDLEKSLDEGGLSKAVNGNRLAPETTGSLKATINCEKATRFTYDYMMNFDHRDHFLFIVDNDTIFNNILKLTTTYDYILPKGQHSLEWHTVKANYTSDAIRLELSNIRLIDVDDWTDLSPNETVSGFTATGWENYGGAAYANGANAEFSFDVTATEPSNISFDYTIDQANLKFYVNDQEVTPGEDWIEGEFHYDLAEAGTYTVKCVSEGTADMPLYDRSSIRNIRLNKGLYTKTTRTYQVVAKTYYSEAGAWDPANGKAADYPVELTLTNSGKAIFKNLFPEDSGITYQLPIHGTYENGEIRIGTIKNQNLGTFFGYDDETYAVAEFYGNRYWVAAGEVAVEGWSIVTTDKDELVIKVSDDELTLVPQSGFGIWKTWSMYDRGNVMTHFYQPNSIMVAGGESYLLRTTTEEIDFGTKYNNNYPAYQTFRITNAGLETEFGVELRGENADKFSVTPMSGNLKPLQSADIEVQFIPDVAGVFAAEVVVYSEGEDIVIPITALVNELPDYSQIVTEGTELIEWAANTDYPWLVEDGVATSSNQGKHNTTSQIAAKFTVPEGKIAQFSCKASCAMEPEYDSFVVYLDGEPIVGYPFRNDHADFTWIIEDGVHEMRFTFNKDTQDQFYAIGDDASISDVRLTFKDRGADCAALYEPQTYFRDIVPVDEVGSSVAYIVNKGTNNLSVTDITGDEHFSAAIPENNNAAPGETLLVPLTFQCEDAGEYSGEVTIHTTGGDIVVKPTATADYVKYLSSDVDYNTYIPYCVGYTSITGNNYPLTTQSIYPEEIIDDMLIGAELESITFFSMMVSDVDFSCPNVIWEIGESETTQVTEKYREGLTEVYSGEMVDLVNYELTIPFKETYKYTGSNLRYQCQMLASEDYAGNTRTNFGFYTCEAYIYDKASGVTDDTYGLQNLTKLPFMRVKYKKGTGVENTLRPLSEIKAVRYYTLDGVQVAELQKGINIIQTIYKDGSTSTTKQFVK